MKTKELVLEALSEAKKSQTAISISGEELAKKCQVSRADFCNSAGNGDPDATVFWRAASQLCPFSAGRVTCAG